MKQTILDHPILSERYFFPRHESLATPFWVENGPVRLSCYYQPKFPNAKTVIYFHGNGEVVGDYLETFVPVFEQMGVNLFLAEYRAYQMSGGEPGLVSLLADVAPIIQATGQPLEKIVLFGRSIGSLYALHGASLFPQIPGLILESAIGILLERVLMRAQPEELDTTLTELQNEVNHYFNHQEKLSLFQGASLIMHAEHDSMVHNRHAKALYQWAPEPKMLKLFPQGDHNDIFYVNAQEYFQLIYQFISQLP